MLWHAKKFEDFSEKGSTALREMKNFLHKVSRKFEGIKYDIPGIIAAASEETNNISFIHM